MPPKFSRVAPRGAVLIAVSTAVCILLAGLVAWAGGGSPRGALRMAPAYLTNGSELSAGTSQVDLETFEGIFGRLLNRVSNISIRTQAAAVAAEAAEHKGTALEQQLQLTEQRLLNATGLILEILSKGVPCGGTDAAAASSAATPEGAVSALEKQVKEMDQRAKGAEVERDRLRHAAHSLFEDIRIAVDADMRQLAGLLHSQPSLLEERRNAMAAAPQRGILVSAGTGKHLANSFVNLHVIRHHLKCTLPASLMYWGEAENIPDATKTFFKEHLSDISFVDASQIPYPNHQRPVKKERDTWMGGFKYKVYAIYNAPYQEIMFLDSDSTPLIDPTALFDIPEFQQHGNLFFPDRWAIPVGAEFSVDERMRLYQYLGLLNPWAEDKKGTWPPQTDSGQLLLNRHMHADVLEWLLFLNSRNEFTYRVAWGDKDTFRASFDLAGKRDSFYLSPHRIAEALYMTNTNEGIRFKVRGYTQLAPNGSVAFIHRSWFTKYDPNSDEARPCTHFTVELTDERGRVNDKLSDLREDQVQVVSSEKCTYNPYDMTNSLKQCGFDSHDTSMPIPVFPIPESSYVAHSVRAADYAFSVFRLAMSGNSGIMP